MKMSLYSSAFYKLCSTKKENDRETCKGFLKARTRLIAIRC